MNILGIDIGTTSLSFVIMDMVNEQIQKRRTIKNDSAIISSKTYEMLQNPDEIWSLVQQVLGSWDLKKEGVKGIGLTGQMHGMLYVDSQGNAVSPLYTWQDNSGGQCCLKGKSYVHQLSDITGYKVATGFACVTYYVHQKMRTIPREAVSFCTIMDYIGMKLTGRKEPLIDTSNAASFGLFDLEKLCFDKQAIKKAGLSYELFPVVTTEKRILGYTKEGLPVMNAIGDNQASFLGAVKNHEQSILVNVGTGSQISFMVPAYRKVEGMETRPFLDGQYLLVNSPLCGGRAYALLAEFYQQIINGFGEYTRLSYETNMDTIYGWMNELLEKHFAHIQEDEHRMEIHPAFSGTRSDPGVRGSITGIGISSLTPAAFVYGMLEGIVKDLHDAFINCQSAGRLEKELLVGSGNGLRKNLHLQKLFENIFGLSLVLSENEEEAACGAAIYCQKILYS